MILFEELNIMLSGVAVVLNLSNFQEIWNTLEHGHSLAVPLLLQSSFRHPVERSVIKHFIGVKS